MELDDAKIVVGEEVVDQLEERVLQNNRREIERIKEAVIEQKRRQEHSIQENDEED